MASFSTNMKEWDGGYAPVSPITAQKSDPWGELAAKVVPGLLDAAGKGYAQAKGANILGMDTTAEEAQQAVTDFDKIAPFTQDESNTPDQKAQVDDMKAAALRKFGTNDKKIQALVSAGKISSLEANARRHQMIQENLSNPVLAMFKDEFMEASTAFTGGPGLTERYFGAYMPTEEERTTLAAAEQVITSKAKFQVQVEELVMNAGVSREQAVSIIREQGRKESQLAEAEFNSKMRGFTSQESFVAGMQVVDAFMQQSGGAIAKIAASGKKLGDTEMQTLQGQLAQSFQQNMARLQQFGQKMTSEDYNKVRTELEGQYKNAVSLINDSDGYKFYERAINRTKLHNESVVGKAYAELASKAPYVLAAYKISPALGDAWVGAMGGDLSSQMAMSTHPFFKLFTKELGHVDMSQATSEAYNNVAENKSDKWSFSSAIGWMKEMVTPGKVAATTSAVTQSPDAYRAGFATAFKNQEMSLKYFADSDEWVANGRTPEGAKVNALMLVEKMKAMRGLQLVNKEKIPSTIKITIPMPIEYPSPWPGLLKYEFKADSEIDPTVQKELAQAYKILSRSPATLKELGVSSPDEFINKALTYK